MTESVHAAKLRKLGLQPWPDQSPDDRHKMVFGTGKDSSGPAFTYAVDELHQAWLKDGENVDLVSLGFRDITNESKILTRFKPEGKAN